MFVFLKFLLLCFFIYCCYYLFFSDYCHNYRTGMCLCQVSHFLFRGLPLHQWQPTDADIEILRRWLISSEMKSVENHLARLIVDHMNWGIDISKNATFLSLELHYGMALMLMNAYATHVSSKQIQALFTDGHTQASRPSL